MEVISHIRYEKVNEVLVGINMVEVQKNRSVFIDGGCEVQSNIFI